MRLRFLAFFRITTAHILRKFFGSGPNRQFTSPFLLARHTFDDGEICFLHPARLEQLAHRTHRAGWRKHISPSSKVCRASRNGLVNCRLALTRKISARCAWIIRKKARKRRRISVSLMSSDLFTLIEASPLTGRTHQIRLHLAESGSPIVCDEDYGRAQTKRITFCTRP